MFMLFRLLFVFFIFSLMSISASADDYIVEYGKVGKWTVFGAKEKTNACVVDTDNANVTLRIVYHEEVGAWAVAQPYYGEHTRNGYAVIINGQIAYDNGPAWNIEFTSEGDGWGSYFDPDSQAFEKRLRSGSKLELNIGEGWQTFSLKNSSAALDMVIDCANNNGRKPARRVVKNQPRNQAPLPLGTEVRNCNTPTTGNYRCNVTVLPPEAGYESVFSIESIPLYTHPSYFVRVKSERTSDVWISMGVAPWSFYGEWVSDRPNAECIWPGANQGNEANGNLGQDAWELCVR